ncbi:MAG: hypothetical protein AAFY29_10975 [Pseudomonadota bacterium]
MIFIQRLLALIVVGQVSTNKTRVVLLLLMGEPLLALTMTF